MTTAESPSVWEVGASIYPWDMHDEGTETVLDNLQQLSCVNSVYLIGLMHSERHPWPTTDVFPRNPMRSSYVTEDSAVYWTPDPARYGRIKPTPTRADFLKDVDWLEMLTRAARRRGLRTGLEITHTVLDRETLRRDVADCRQLDIFGGALSQTHVEGIDAICLNHPDIQEYILNLYSETIANYDIDYIQNCIMPFPMPARYLLAEHESDNHPLAWVRQVPALSGCFCRSCHDAAAVEGLDLGRIRDVLLRIAKSLQRPTESQERDERLLLDSNMTTMALLVETPELFDWIRFKCLSLTKLYGRINERAHQTRESIDNRLDLYVTSHQEYAGLSPRALRGSFNSVRVCCYAENVGGSSTMDGKRRVLNAARRAFGRDKHMNSAIGVLQGATAESVTQGVLVAGECGMDGITLGHYDGATFEMLAAVKDGLRRLGHVG